MQHKSRLLLAALVVGSLAIASWTIVLFSQGLLITSGARPQPIHNAYDLAALDTSSTWVRVEFAIDDDQFGRLSSCRQLHRLECLDAHLLTARGINVLNDLHELRELTLENVKLDRVVGSQIAALAKLDVLDISGAVILERGIFAMMPHDSLTYLYASRVSQLGEDDLDRIARTPKLESLDVSDTNVTPLGLAKLIACKQLRQLKLTDCRHLTKQDVESFRTARPDVNVIY